MKKIKKRKNVIQYFAKNITVVIALVMIWRGVWYILDEIDILLFGEYGAVTGFIGLVVGLAILYLPDSDLKEIEKL